METTAAIPSAENRSWEKIVMRYSQPDLRKSLWQIANTLLPYIFIWFLLYKSLGYSYLLTILLSLLASGFLIRLFIIFHDCGHNSFFRSRKANVVIGKIMGILTFTPYHSWHHQHRIHHITSANLDKRGIGDVWTMTVDEYQNSSRSMRFIYKAFRNPFIMFTVGPLFVIFVKNRFSRKNMTRQEKSNIYFTNFAVVLLSAIISLLIGIKAYLVIMLPILLISHSIGIWLFYIQHQYDTVSWNREKEWNYATAALTGSSFLKLPAILQWFTGNIGFHHVHHLSSKIPNYNLEACHYENKMFLEIRPVKLFSTFSALYLSLWDEAERRLISFRGLRSLLQSPIS